MRYLMVISFLLSNTALASSIGQTKIDSVLQALLNYLTAAPARIIAVLAIVAVGYGTLHLGRMPKQRAIAVVVGIGIIFGGGAILQMLGLGQG